MPVSESIYLAKALECLAGAESEFANHRYNNVANRCYYAVFLAAIAALIESGASPASRGGTWSHQAVQAAFAGQLVQRQKKYPPELRDVLLRNQILRYTADYERHWVTNTQAGRSLRRTAAFIAAIQGNES